MKAQDFFWGIQVFSLVAVVCAAKADPFRWDAPGGEFSVTFDGKSEISAIEARPAEGVARLDVAAHRRADGGVEEAEVSVNQRTKPIAEAEALHHGEAWAKVMGLSNAKMTFDEFHPDDRRLTVTGNTIFEGASVNMKGVLHWGKRFFLLVWIKEPTGRPFPSPEGGRFLQSVHQSFR